MQEPLPSSRKLEEQRQSAGLERPVPLVVLCSRTSPHGRQSCSVLRGGSPANVPLGQLAVHVPKSMRRTGSGEPTLHEVQAVSLEGAEHVLHDEWHRAHRISVSGGGGEGMGGGGGGAAYPTGHAVRQPPTCLYG